MNAVVLQYLLFAQQRRRPEALVEIALECAGSRAPARGCAPRRHPFPPSRQPGGPPARAVMASTSPATSAADGSGGGKPLHFCKHQLAIDEQLDRRGLGRAPRYVADAQCNRRLHVGERNRVAVDASDDAVQQLLRRHRGTAAHTTRNAARYYAEVVLFD